MGESRAAAASFGNNGAFHAYMDIVGHGDLVYLWWAFFLVWLVAIGWKLHRLGKQRGSPLNSSINVKR